MIVTQTQQINGQVNHASIDQGTGLPSASQMSIPMGSGSMMVIVTSSSSSQPFSVTVTSKRQSNDERRRMERKAKKG